MKERQKRGGEEGEEKACLNWPVWPRWAVMVVACQTLCLNSWPGLTCIPCIRPTTTNSSVLFGSFQCQAWESCATHIYTPLHSSGGLSDGDRCTALGCCPARHSGDVTSPEDLRVPVLISELERLPLCLNTCREQESPRAAAEVQPAPVVSKPLEDGGMDVGMGVSEAVRTGERQTDRQTDVEAGGEIGREKERSVHGVPYVSPRCSLCPAASEGREETGTGSQVPLAANVGKLVMSSR
ncbi:unnamed protein product [Pleuronectes platessa]|uniref:Uncharacterized protein n=1 Tax=Pleuronectes platessa TaxID=8262 RepID=A0A9N7YB17_PLEPL|nr:unnamed protein product [Pleuronectes platessa]